MPAESGVLEEPSECVAGDVVNAGHNDLHRSGTDHDLENAGRKRCEPYLGPTTHSGDAIRPARLPGPATNSQIVAQLYPHPWITHFREFVLKLARSSVEQRECRGADCAG